MDRLAKCFLRYRDRGDVDALGEVFDLASPKLLQLAMHLCRGAADAEDVLQATFVRAMQKASTFVDSEPLLPWLCGILAGEARNQSRRSARRQAEPLPELAADEGGPIAAAERSELIAGLRAHVETLPQEQRQALLLQLRHGLSPLEIAEVLEVPAGTVRMRIHRGLAALRRLLPATLAAWLAARLPARGLQGVRQAVLRQATAAATEGAAVTLAGAAALKGWLIGAVVLCAAALWWMRTPDPGSPSPADVGIRAEAVHAGSSATAAAAEPQPVASGPAQRSLVAAEAGSLRVRAFARQGGAGLADLPLVVRRDDCEAGSDGAVLTMRTDAEGVAVFAPMAAGTWRVGKDGEGAEPATVQVVAGRQAACELALPGCRLRGVVVDEAGAPVAGASIRVGRSDLTDGPQRLPLARLSARLRTAAISAADGSFACDCTEAETHVGAEQEGFAASWSQLTAIAARQGIERWRLVLAPRQLCVTVAVRDERGVPLAGALVGAFAAESRTRRAADGTLLQEPLPQFARADAAGIVRLPSLRPGKAMLWAAATGRRQAPVFTELQAGSDVERTVTLSAGADLVGRVRAADGQPVAGTRITATSPSVRNGYINWSVTAADGSFALPDLPLRPLVLLVFGPNGPALLEHEVEPKQAGTLRVDLQLPDLPTLRGRVVDAAGNGVPRWSVLARDLDAQAADLRAQTDAYGRFAMVGVRAQRLQLVASWPDGTLAAELAEVSPFGGEIELRITGEGMPSGAAHGRLVDLAGNPVGGARLRLATPRPPHPVRATAADGSFQFAGLLPEESELWLELDDGKRLLRRFELARGEDLDLGELRLLPQARLQLEFTAADGSPWRAVWPEPDLERPGGHRCDAQWRRVDGVLEATLDAGPLRVGISGPDLILQPVDLELAPGELRRLCLPLAIGRSRQLVFAGEATRPVVDHRDVLHAEVLDGNGALILRQDLRRSPHGDGNWTLERAFAFGDYAVRGRTDSGRRYAGRFAVGDDIAEPVAVDVPQLR